MSRLDVLHVTSAHVVRDTRIFVKEARALADAALKVGIVGPGAIEDHTNYQNIELITIPAPTSRLARFTTFALRLDKIVRRHQPKVVHIHDPDLLGIARIWKRRGIKIVYDVHEDFPKALLSRAWLGPHWVRKIASTLVNQMETRATRWVDGFVFADRHLATRFQGCHGVVVRNYLETSEWPELPRQGPAEDQIRCVYVGDITVARGVFRMCEATYAAAGQIHLHLAGPIPKDLRIKVEAHPAKSWITLHGRKSRSEVAELLSKADVALCLPQPTPAYVDALPVKILEYLYNHLPVVATQLPRLERETHLQSGLFLVPWAASSQDIVQAISTAAQARRPDLRNMLERHYNWQNEAKELVRFYRSFLCQPSARQRGTDRLMTSNISAISAPETSPPAFKRTSTASVPK